MKVFATPILLALLLAPIWASAAEQTSSMEVGLRGGIDSNSSNADEHYDAVELYFFRALPWGARLIGNTTLSTRFDFGATYLEGGDDEGAMLAAGVDLALGFWDDSLELEAGFRPTWMFDHEYGDDDFGGGLQFTSHAGLALNWHRAALSYRYQHTSNAGIYDENPGFDLHMVGLGYRF